MELAPAPNRYHTDHSIVYGCLYHVIFYLEYRRPLLVDAVAERLKELVLEKQADYGYAVMQMEVMPNHVHLLLDVDPWTHVSASRRSAPRSKVMPLMSCMSTIYGSRSAYRRSGRAPGSSPVLVP